jgi:hypothetical protein
MVLVVVLVVEVGHKLAKVWELSQV